MKTKVFILILCLIFSAFTSTQTFEIDNIDYEIISLNNHEVAVVKGADKTQIVIPNRVNYEGKEYTVTSIWHYAFYNCKSLSYIDFPGTLTNNCSLLESIDVASNNINFSSIDGVLFSKDCN